MIYEVKIGDWNIKIEKTEDFYIASLFFKTILWTCFRSKNEITPNNAFEFFLDHRLKR